MQLLTHKALREIEADSILFFLLLVFRENKAWHFLWIICLPDDSQEMSSLIFTEKYKKKKKKKKKKKVNK